MPKRAIPPDRLEGRRTGTRAAVRAARWCDAGKRGVRCDLAIAIAFAGTAMMGMQFMLVARGRVLYVEGRCQMCHSIEGEGNTRSPLDA